MARITIIVEDHSVIGDIAAPMMSEAMSRAVGALINPRSDWKMDVIVEIETKPKAL